MLETLLASATRVLPQVDTPDDTRETEDRWLTKQQRIIRLLSENDGKMWQQGLVKATGWSPSMTSRTLSAMEDKDQIVRIQIGREKLVTVPEWTAFDEGGSRGQSILGHQFSQ